jgi:exonuclease III
VRSPDRLAPFEEAQLVFPMLPNCCLVWNVRGINSRARRNVVRDLLGTHGPSLVCLQETKVVNFCNSLAIETLGSAFDYAVLPSVGASGGVLLAWLRDRWHVSDVVIGRFTISATMSAIDDAACPWRITAVYGPQLEPDKVLFLDELLAIRNNFHGPWLTCGDFNMIYRARDKNNDRLDRRGMRRFRTFLNHAQL